LRAAKGSVCERRDQVEQNGGLSVAQLGYNRVGDLVQVVDPISATTVMKYDSRGLRRKLEDPDISNCGTPANCPWLFGYDDRGQMTSRKDAKGQEIQFLHDELGRVYLKDYICSACSETGSWLLLSEVGEERAHGVRCMGRRSYLVVG